MSSPVPTDLLAGIGTGIEAGYVDGHDFYPPDGEDSSYQEPADPISEAVGTAGYMSAHVVSECKQHVAEGAFTEPCEFDRFYFPPQDPTYAGPAPVLIDILEGVTPEELEQARRDHDCAFKADWCRANGIRYVVLTDSEDLFLSPEQLRARMYEAIPAETIEKPVDLDAAIIAYQRPAAKVAAKPRSRSTGAPKGKPGRRRAGIQRVREDN